jgi:hypothetical protein
VTRPRRVAEPEYESSHAGGVEPLHVPLHVAVLQEVALRQPARLRSSIPAHYLHSCGPEITAIGFRLARSGAGELAGAALGVRPGGVAIAKFGCGARGPLRGRSNC